MTTLVYVPGLGSDSVTKRQHDYLLWWTRKRRIELLFFSPSWHSNESYADKWLRLKNLAAKAETDTVVIIGVSAGGSLALRAHIETNPKSELHLVCAKLLHAEAIGMAYRQRAPALYESVAYAEKYARNSTSSAKLDKITCFIPLKDSVVPTKDARIAGARLRRIPLIGHTLSIVWYLLFLLPKHK